MKSEKGTAGAKTARPKKPKIKRINSTTTILWRYFTFFVLAVITVIALVCYGIMSGAVLSNTRKRLRAVGEDLTLTMLDPNVPDRVILQRIADYVLTDGVDVFIFAEDGTALINDGTLTEEKMQNISNLVISQAGEWEPGKAREFTSRDGKKAVLNFVSCVPLGGSGRAYLAVRYPVNNLTQTVGQIEIYVLIVALGAFVIAFFVSYSLANKLSGPIRDISGTAQKLAKGDYSVQFNSAQYAEIAQLSDTLNYMKDEIKKSDDFRKELVANVSHDLKTPLTMIKAYASMIREISGNDPEKRDKHLQVIIDEADRLTGLVNDILSTSKITAGLEQSNKKIINLTELLYSVINKFSYLQETQGYSIMVDVEPNLYTEADEEQIYQVVYNLISNAINYTGEDKTIFVTLKADAENKRIKFAVRDTGKGIDEEELAHIWDRYYRSKDSHLRPVKGTGLGLNIVKVILQRHSFDFGVNTEKGKGSTFFVDFPKA